MIIENKKPQIEGLSSQIVTYEQTTLPIYESWLVEMKEENLHNRKQWEWVYIVQALKENSMLKENKKGLGFGVGSEPIPAILAKNDCSVLATEINIEKTNKKGWVKNRNKYEQLKALNAKNICAEQKFYDLVDFRDVDMNNIPSDLRNYDFVWSSCSLEHLGTMEKCKQFIYNSMECLKPGGIAVHTTEYTLAKKKTITKGSTVFFRRKDIIEVAKELEKAGNEIILNFKHCVS